LYLDLDNFKTINDSLGHSAGDELLRVVGAVLLGCVRRADTVARLGGDEFAILIEDVDNRDEVVHLAQRILSGLHHPVVIGSHRVSTSASIGITFGGADATGEQLLRNADLAMYRAKAQGKDRFEEFEDHMHQAVLAHLELENDLRRALAEEQFVVHYQPIVDLSNRALVGFEALVRWHHPTRGLLGPGEFINKAEELGIIGGIDFYVLSEACCQMSRWRHDGLIAPDLVLDVNVSASEVADPLLAERVAGVLDVHGFDAGRLVLEITESAIMTNVRGAAVNLRSLKNLGLRLAVDDFGTGYSSLTHLAALPIDVLKIDRSFVAIDASVDDQPDLARAIIQLAETLSLHTVAEGVETEEQAAYLLSLGCRWAQGFHLGQPLDVEATEDLLRQLRDAAT
jgi:diguanylate cyclase (GGDEF)-like protein